MDKLYVVDGKIEIRFAVSESNNEKAKEKAEQTIKKLIETGLLGSCGYTFSIKKVVEVKPVP